MAEDKKNLSPELVNKLERLINKSDGLLNRQLEIISQVMQGEVDVGNLRISYLNTYFDTYSKSLDMLARKHSQLNDAFLILSNKLEQQQQGLATTSRFNFEGVGGGGRSAESNDEASGGDKQGDKKPAPVVADTTAAISDFGDDISALIDRLTNSCRQRVSDLESDIARATSSIDAAGTNVSENQLEQYRRASNEKHRLENSIMALEMLRYRAEQDSIRSSTELSLTGARGMMDAAHGTARLVTEIADTSAEIQPPQVTADVQQATTPAIKEDQGSTVDIISELQRQQLAALDDDTIATPPQETTPVTVEVASVVPEQKSNDTTTLLLISVLQDLLGGYQNVSSQNAKENAAQRQFLTELLAIASTAGAGNGTDGGGNNNGGGGGNNPPEDDGQPVRNTITDGQRNNLRDGKEDSDTSMDDLTMFADKMASFYKNNEEIRAGIISDTAGAIEAIEERHSANRLKQQNRTAAIAEEIEASIMDIELARYASEQDLIDISTTQRLEALRDANKAELKALQTRNAIMAEQMRLQTPEGQEEAGEVRAREAESEDFLARAKEREDAIAKYTARRELEEKRKNGGILSKEASARIKKETAEKFALEKLYDEKLIEERTKKEYDAAKKKDRQEMQEGIQEAFGAGKTWDERKDAIKDLTHDESGNFDLSKSLSAAVLAMSSIVDHLRETANEIGAMKGKIDTRMQGSSMKQSGGSYWDQMVKDMAAVGAINPFYKQSDFAKNVQSLVEKGIAFEVEQRAFLMTVKDKIATTFDVSNGTLLRLIRIQQSDTTAARMGMEASLNAFLNNMYETTEYLEDVASSVRTALEESQSLMDAKEATELEYQVQKWMGSLYSVGMSQTAVQGIANALGQITAGQLEGISGEGGAGNLLIMAANDAGLSIADILIDGIDASDTNKLLQASVNYLAELAASAKDNKVVQQQLADVFGVKASDLKAATNLAAKGSISNIYSQNVTYSNMLNQLYQMAGTMGKRTSMGEMIDNMWANGQYSLSGSLASNPVSYMLMNLSKVIKDLAGGIPLPDFHIYGTGIELNTSVSDLMNVAALVPAVFSTLFGAVATGIGNSFDGKKMLEQLGVPKGSALKITPRGSGISLTSGGASSTSSSGYAGNSSGSDISESTKKKGQDDGEKQLIEAKEEREEDRTDLININVLKIYELLYDVAKGDSYFNVKMAGYGLTSLNNKLPAMGGVAGLDNAGAGTDNSSSSGSNGGSSSGGNDLGSANSSTGGGSGSAGGGVWGGSIDLGGWTMI